jgi:hypothetical protein
LRSAIAHLWTRDARLDSGYLKPIIKKPVTKIPVFLFAIMKLFF